MDMDRVFMSLAEDFSKKGTCDRARVGAVIVKDLIIYGTGFNTSPAGLPTCDEIGHLMIDDHCCRTIHAEQNAILNALKYIDSLKEMTMYVTHEPCIHCRKLIIQSGIKRVIFKNLYRSLDTNEMDGDVEWIHYDELIKTL